MSEATSLDVGHQLAGKVLPAPQGYLIDPDPGVNGRIDAAGFAAVASDGSAASAGFVGGFKGSLLDPASHEAIVVTLLQFDSAADATRYGRATAAGTLSAYAATSAPMADPPGARRFDGTRSFQDDWAHAVVDERGSVYMSLVYLSTGAGSAPIELTAWARQQYARLG